MKINFKDIIIFVIVFLIIFAIQLIVKPYEVKAEAFEPNISSAYLFYGTSKVARDSVQDFGNYTRYTFPNFSIMSPWSVELGFTYNFPSSADYFYIYGYSTYSITSAYLNDRNYCENIANSSSDFALDNNEESDTQSLRPYAFKCKVGPNNGSYINLMGNAMLHNTIIMSPIIYIKRQMYYTTNSTSSSIENYIQQDIQYSKEQIQKQEETNQAIKDTNDTLKDDTTDNPSNSFNDYNDKLAKNGVITNLITLPIRLFTNILNSINGTCTTFTLGDLMGTNLTLPCINIANYLGSTIWNVIDILISGLFVRSIAKKMIKVFENFSSMREGDVLGD